METNSVLQTDSLWNRIQKFSIDDPIADFPFSKKLAKEENWTLDFTNKAIEEYKKFVYLCCILPKGASPSTIVDKVWHMHLMYTQNYWEEFCPNILQQELHHHPSSGGFIEKVKHENWFEDTLKNYEDTFQQKPPEEIWKPDEIKKRRFRKLKFLFLAIISLIIICFSDSFIEVFIKTLVTGFLFLIIYLISIAHDPGKKMKSSDGSGCGTTGCGNGGGSCSSGCGGGCGGCSGG
ncbi:glycine-rich domain-containing protein [Chryseobacterium taiwanense]|uniref:Glycine-rich domain-containing protein-like n=1 Tax=Chryseobacterium taiwanense TaxID=363331 RepID=A0A0B4DBW1_9FLAO|nr:hypothetical protein [Chryseobacterium taiwanense]KIC61785.1 hypothetical protein RM51_15480 [Chryseobacterium taiwanense]